MLVFIKKRFVRLTLFFVVCLNVGLLLGGCADPKLSPIGSDGVILAFGDSLTVGVGTSAENSYPVILESLAQVKVVSSGVSGETTVEGVKRLPLVLDRIRPDVLILVQGGNDILRKHKFDDIKANLNSMIEMAQARDIPVVLLGVPQKNIFSDSAPFYESLAQTYDLVFDGELIAQLLRSPALKSDPIHFNAQGYRKLAEGIYDLLERNGAL